VTLILPCDTCLLPTDRIANSTFPSRLHPGGCRCLHLILALLVPCWSRSDHLRSPSFQFYRPDVVRSWMREQSSASLHDECAIWDRASPHALHNDRFCDLLLDALLFISVLADCSCDRIVGAFRHSDTCMILDTFYGALTEATKVNGWRLLNWMALVFMLVGAFRLAFESSAQRGWFLACVAFALFFNWLPFLCERGDVNLDASLLTTSARIGGSSWMPRA